MKRNVFNLLIFVSVIAGSVFVTSCDEPYTINTKKMIQDEQDLMNEYLLIVEDTLAAYGDSINRLDSLGYVFFELEEGTGEPIMDGEKVAFRYMYFEIARDSAGVPGIYPYLSNYEEQYPRSYTKGEVDPRSGLYSGIDLAIGHMSFGSKARVFVSSSLWDQRYTPRVIDLEVTYVGK
jgi:hypothetical protein